MDNGTHLEWLVPSRCRIQTLLLRLYNVWNALAPTGEDARRPVCELLLGVTFSLWRSVFLLDKPRNPESLHEATVSFLKLLIEDNTILYRDDRKTGAWTGGYYLSNPCLRLRELAQGRLEDAAIPSPTGIDKVLSYLAKSYQERLTTDPTSVWDDACAAAEAVCQSLENAARGA